MGRRGMGTVVAGLQTLFSVGTTAALSDGQLLERFLSAGDETAQAAFACLVERHGAMVMRVCRDVLHDAHAAEDAFQVTFLVLARKAGSIKKHDSIASWLFAVARRVARKAQAQDSRRARLEAERTSLAQEPNPCASEPVVFHAEIHEEIDRLPDRYRAAVVLCYFEGLTQEQAATRLAVPTGTIKARLSRARERLKKRLVRRGLAPSVFMAYAGEMVQTAVPRSLVEKTALAAFQVWLGRSAGLSASALALFEGMMRAMLITQLKTVVAAATVMIASGLIATSLAVPARLASDPPQPPPRAQEPAKAPAPEPQAAPEVPNTLTLKKGSITRTTRQEGTLRAFDSVAMSPRHAGVLESLDIDLGSHVKKGQVLAVVQDVDLDIAVQTARALEQQAVIRLVKAQAEHEVALASARAVEAKIEARGSRIKELEAMVTFRIKERDRGRELLSKNGIGDSQFDEIIERLTSATARLDLARSDLKVTKAELHEAQAKVAVAKSAMDEAKGGVELARIDLTKAQIDLKSMTLTAPFDGVVAQLSHHVGEYVFGAGFEKGEPLLTVVRTTVMRCEVLVPEKDAAILKIGDAATIRLDGRPETFQGKISRMGDTLDAGHNLRAEVDLDNADGRLRNGQHCRAEITLQEPPDSIVIPRTALIGPLVDVHHLYCFRMLDGQAVRTLVMIDFIDDDRAKVFEGLKAGDVVIADAEAWSAKAPPPSPSRPGR